AFIDGILKPVSIGVAGLSIMGLGRVLDKQHFALDLAYFDAVLLVGWIVLVISIRREYVKSLIDTLYARRLDLSGPGHLVADDATVQVLKSTILSRKDEHVLSALELVPSLNADFEPELLSLLDHPAPRVRIAAVKLLGNTRMVEDLASIEKMLSDEDESVRAA